MKFRSWKIGGLVALAALCFGAVALANVSPRHLLIPKDNPYRVLNAVPLDGSGASLSFEFAPRDNAVAGLASAQFYVEFDHDGNDGAITFDCTVSRDGNDTDYLPSTCTVASGTCTLNIPTTQFTTATLSADTNYAFRWDIRGYRDFQCTVAHDGSPSATDTVTVHVQMVTQ